MRTFGKFASAASFLFIVSFGTDLSAAPRFQFQAPEARMEEWRNGFLSYLEKNQDLTGEQILAIQNLADLTDRSAFANSLSPKRREILQGALQELSRVLPYPDYVKLLRSFDDVRFWLLANGLASQFEVAASNCNCTVDANCQSGICRDVACELAGTTHTGVCSSGNQGIDPGID